MNTQKISTKIVTAVAGGRLRRKGILIGRSLKLDGWPIVSASPGSTIAIGRNFVAVSKPRSQVIGVNHPVIIRTLSPASVIEIGDDVAISGGTIVASGHVRIGDGCLIGANCLIVDTDFHPVHSPSRRYADRPSFRQLDAVAIGQNVFIGTGSKILKGVRIGDNSVVGAGSVVVSSFPANSIIAGAPAKWVSSVQVPSDGGQSK